MMGGEWVTSQMFEKPPQSLCPVLMLEKILAKKERTSVFEVTVLVEIDKKHNNKSVFYWGAWVA